MADLLLGLEILGIIWSKKKNVKIQEANRATSTGSGFCVQKKKDLILLSFILTAIH